MRKQALNLDGLSPRMRRLLALGIRGGAGDEVDPDVLLTQAAGAADLTDDDIVALKASLKAAGKQLLAGDDVDDAVLAKCGEIRDAIKALGVVEGERQAEADRIDGEAQALLAELDADDATDGGDGEPGDGEAPEGDNAGDGEGDDGNDLGGEGETPAAGEGDEGGADGGGGDATTDADADAERIAAAGSSPGRTRARRPRATQPRPAAAPELALRASANIPGVQAGEVLDDDGLLRVMDRAIRASGGRRHMGPRQEIPLFSLGVVNPEEIFGQGRTLGRDSRVNGERIAAVTSGPALRASGGICAPVPVQYDLPILGIDARPVRDAFARFGADRGGVRLLPPPVLADLAGAIGVWTNDNDIDPGSDGPETKPCLRLDCPDDVETLVAAITQCLEVGNFRQRFFPEQVRAWTTLAGVQLAKVADTRLLQKLGDESTQVGVTEILGSTRTILAALERACAALRNHHRLDPMFPMRFLAPAWLRNNMITDLIREMPGSTAERLATSEATIDSFLTARHINVTWFLDGEAGQIFDAQLDGLLNGWPDEAICYLYVEGTWIHLDAGMMDFGIVRDSTLNSTNDFQMFSEIFEESAFHGVPGTSLRLSIDVCPSGQAAALDDTSGICTSGS